MDFFDLFSALPFAIPNPPGSGRSLQEQIAGAIGLFVLPTVDFLIVLLSNLYENPTVALIVLPIAFSVGAVIVCRFLKLPAGWTTLVTLGCLALCMTASMAALVLAVFASIFSSF